MKKCAVIFAILPFLLCSMAVSASLIDNGITTYDDVSGLDWLDLTETQNMSKFEVTAQLASGGLLEGWRYASTAQVTGLYSQFGLPVSATGVSGFEPNIDALIRLVGDTLAAAGLQGYNGVYGMVSDMVSVSTSYVSYAFYSGHQGHISHIGDQKPGSVEEHVGSWLIREHSDVPEPTTIALFAMGLAGFGFSRRKSVVQ